MIEAVVFDLDDTLYPEASYCRSGFRVVARELARRGYVDEDEAWRVLCHIHFEEGRDGVFDKASERLGFPAGIIRELVALYREHEPEGLELHADASELLSSLRGIRKTGIVTDGWLVTQRAKVRALGVDRLVDHVFLADVLGRERWKPHPEPFLRTLEALGIEEPSRAIFVGDNPERDVAGALAAGLFPVRIVRPDAHFRERPDPHGARTVQSLSELPDLLNLLDAES